MPPRPTHIAQHLKAAATNANGRLLRVDDGTGYQIFAYDRLGNVAENIRAIALPFEDSVYNFRMLFEYDSWNRVQRIVYPDSEVVSYSYDLGGQLYSVSTFKNNVSSSLINSILYDEFGHRTQVNFGNGVTTNYSYDILQRLNTLQTYSNNANLQKISYDFDLEDNITKVENTASGANGLGGAYVNTYNYDDLYRLTAANGSYSGNNTNYSLEMSYTPAGRLCNKLQGYTGTGNIYAYSPNNKQHAIRRIYNGITNELSNLRWDNNGNLAQQTVYSVNNNVPTYQNMRALYWDEDDRLNLVAGDGYLSYYAYGYDGNRAIKMTGNAAIDQTGTLLNSTNLENITIYPNEYLTVTQAEYTKYYYAGGNRIASKIGTGGFEKMQRLCTEDLNISGNANTLFGNALQQIVNITNQPNDEFPVNVCGGYSVATELLADPLPDFYISQTNLNFTQNNLLQQFRQNLAGGTEPVYYFHSDHLGSASWITDGTGAAVQHLQYLPFGEHFVNEQSSGYFERFTFTGKERDLETGYYYHGARFNSSDIGWLSVDPMSDKYPSMTPYNYCAWNPIKLVDPEGEEVRRPPRYAESNQNYRFVSSNARYTEYRHSSSTTIRYGKTGVRNLEHLPSPQYIATQKYKGVESQYNLSSGIPKIEHVAKFVQNTLEFINKFSNKNKYSIIEEQTYEYTDKKDYHSKSYYIVFDDPKLQEMFDEAQYKWKQAYDYVTKNYRTPLPDGGSMLSLEGWEKIIKLGKSPADTLLEIFKRNKKDYKIVRKEIHPLPTIQQTNY